MNWLEVTITTTNEAEEAVSEIFKNYGASGVSIESKEDVLHIFDDPTVNLVEDELFERPDGVSVIRGYFSLDTDLSGIPEGIQGKVASLTDFGLDPGEASLTVKEMADDWKDSWKQYFKPSHVSSRCVVVPSWEQYDPEEGDVILNIDPGAAFGTGTHETTRLCVQAIEDYVKAQDTLVDVGCGTGILSIAAVLLGAKEALGVDLDPLSVKASIENAAINKVSHQTRFLEGNLLDRVEAVSADIVVANILAQAVCELTPDVKRILKPGGLFISSGIIKPFLSDVIRSVDENGFSVLDIRSMGEWYAVIAQNEEMG